MPTLVVPAQHLRSVTTGVRPSSLLQGQFFINEEDGVLCWPDTDGTIRTTWLDNAQGVPKLVATASYTVTNVDRWLVTNAGLAMTVTLPTATAAIAGRQLGFKGIAALGATSSASANVKPVGSNTAGTVILAAGAGKWAQLICDGSAWVIMAAN